MARVLTSRKARVTLTAFVAVGALLIGTSAPGWGQVSAPRVRTLLQSARAAYARGDYEAADRLYQQVQAQQKQLTPAEQSDLANLQRQNSSALQTLQQGRRQLQQAGVLIDQGQRRQAAALLRAASTNQYFTADDKQQLRQLSARTQGAAPGLDTTALPAPAAGQAKDYRTLMLEARSAVERQDWDQAEMLARKAEKLNSDLLPGWMQPWHDSPGKIVQEAQAGRNRARVKEDRGAPPGGSSPLQSMRNMFNWTTKSAPAETPGPNSEPARTVPFPSSSGPDSAAAGQGTAASTAQARKLIQDGFKALRSKNLAQAKQLAQRAQALHPNLEPWEQTPVTLLTEIERQASAAGDMPKMVPAPATNEEPQALLRQARQLFQKGDLEGAARLAARADAVPGNHWGLFSDSPAKLNADIQQASQARNREEATRMLTEARQLFAAGKLTAAKELAWQAQKKHGPYDIWDIGDRPQTLLTEIARAEFARKDVAVPPSSEVQRTQGVAVDGELPGAAELNPGAGMFPPHKQALDLLAEARELQKVGRLIEAREKALQAKQAAVAAQMQGTVFRPEQDNPDLALVQLNGLAHQVCARMLQDVEKLANETSDPQRFQKAEQVLQLAGQLSAAYGYPPAPIQEKTAWLQQLQGKAPAAANPLAPSGQALAAGLPANQKQGLRLCDDARREMRAGQTLLARKIAEEALDPKYGVQEHAAAIIREIDAEEANQRILTSVRNAGAVQDAYIRGDFQQARVIAQSVDTKLLPPDKLAKFREYLTMPEMQPGAVAQAPAPKAGLAPPTAAGPDTVAQAPGKASIGDGAGRASIGDGANPPAGFADRYKAMEEILFMKLRQEGMTVQTRAREAFQAGEYSSALDMLRDYSDRVAQADMMQDRIHLLKSPIDRRVQQYRTLQAQLELNKVRRADLTNGFKREGVRQLAQIKRDEKISELLKQYRGFFQDKQYEKARLVAMQAKELDPDNVAANQAFQMADIARNSGKFHKTEENKANARINLLDTNWEGVVDANTPISLDRTTMEKARKRKTDVTRGIRYGTKTEKELDIERKLLSPTNLNFKDTPLKQAIQDLKYLSNINIIPETAVLEEAGISLDQPLSLEVENISLKSALNILLRKVRLTYVVKDECLLITTEEHAKGKLVQVTYPVADLVVPVQDTTHPGLTDLTQLLNQPNQMMYGGTQPTLPQYNLPNAQPISSYGGSQHASNNGFGSSYQGPSGPVGVSGQRQNWGSPGPKQTIEDQLIKLISNTIAPDSWSEVGGKGQIQYFPLGLGLVVTQTQDIQEQIADLLQALRRLQDLEVAIEIRLISVSESFFERIGLDFDVNLTTSQSKWEPQLTTGVFQPNGFINRFMPNKFVSGMTPAGTFTPDLNIPLNNSSYNYTFPQVGGFPGALGMDGGLSLGLAFLSDIQVFMFLEAAQGDRRANTMQAPRVTVFNGQQAFLTVNDQIPFLVSIFPAQAGSQLYFIPQQIALPVGTSIFVTPVVSADRRFVRLSLTQQMQNLVSANVPLIPIQVPILPFFTGQVPQPDIQVFQVFLQQPATSSIFVQTTVTVPDGGTVLLGGLKTLTETRSEFGPPVLSKIPYVNRLFKNVGYGREVSSLMMMVTPRIIINEEEELIFLEQLPSIERP